MIPGRDVVVVAGYRIGWSAIRRMPDVVAYRLFDTIADASYTRNTLAVRRLRHNYGIVRPELTGPELEAAVHGGIRSAMRYYCEAFRLPARSRADLAAAVRVAGHEDQVRATLATGRSVVCFLGHMGNWDAAGAWCAQYLAPLITVAERLEPEPVYAEFLAFRESLGMRILPLTGGGDILAELESAARAEPLMVPLLADRDLTASGVPVSFHGHQVKMAPGPAVLALRTGAPLFPVSMHYEPGEATRWRTVITFHDPVNPPAAVTTREQIAAMTQGCATALQGAIMEHMEDWHMMQPIFPGTRPLGLDVRP